VPITVESPTALDERQQASVLELADAIEAVDGAPPLSDQGRSQLTSDQVAHFVARSGDELVGYAQLDDSESEPAAELLGEPAALDPLLDGLSAVAALQLWAHGTRSRLLPVLERRGWQRTRVLWQLRRPVSPTPPVVLPAEVTLRPFVVGQDETAWLAVNAAAFAHHPEQGGWTLADLVAREAETWFDPAGFLLAVGPGDELLGFHWTKRHSRSLGEVYVIAVAPVAQGRQLGTTLLTAGIEQLRRAGVREVMLYVDESNAPAMSLYERYGFQRHDHDAQYRLTP
jgi:mycothiol synthase